MEGVEILDMTPGDWPRVREIYQQGLDSGLASFERTAPDWEKWNTGHLRRPRLVLKIEKTVAGWAALSSVSSREVYKGVAEISIYVHKNFHRKGFGKMLLKTLIAASEREGIWTLQAGIFPQNKSSLLMHSHAGFRQVGVREKIGRMNGEWRDVILLERRSKTTGLF